MRHPQNEYRIKKEDYAMKELFVDNFAGGKRNTMTMKLGIQTMTPDEVERLKSLWGDK